MANKLYADIFIYKNQFYWIESASKQKEPLELLKLIEKIVKENIEWAYPPPDLRSRSQQLQNLKEKAKIIYSEYSEEYQNNGYFSFVVTLESDTKKEVIETYHRIQTLFESIFFIPPEVFQAHIFPHLSMRDLLFFATVNKQAYRIIQKAISDRAKAGYGLQDIQATYDIAAPYLNSLQRGIRSLAYGHQEVKIESFLSTKVVKGRIFSTTIILFESSFNMITALVTGKTLEDFKEKNPDILTITIKNLKKAFIIAAKGEEIDVVRLLLACGMHPDSVNDENETALLFAKPNIQVIQALLDKGADPNQANGEETPLWRYLSDREITELLCLKKANVNQLKGGKTPLHEVAEKGWNVSAQILLDNGAEPNSNDQNFNKPLHVVKADIDLIRFLLEKGANPNLPDSKGVYPLSRFLQYPQILLVLCQYGAKIDLCHALHQAVKENLVDSVKALLQNNKAYKAELDRLDVSGLPALFYCKSPEMIRLLHLYNVDINYQTQHHRRTALHLAVQENQKEAVLALLECNANFSLKDNSGNCPAYYCKSDVIKEMIELYQAIAESTQ